MTSIIVYYDNQNKGKMMETEKKKRLNVSISEDRMKRLKAKAAKEGTTLKLLVNQWVSDYLRGTRK